MCQISNKNWVKLELDIQYLQRSLISKIWCINVLFLKFPLKLDRLNMLACAFLAILHFLNVYIHTNKKHF